MTQPNAAAQAAQVGAAPLPAALYQGSANSWECDEMGHLNVRYHVERAMIGMAVLACELGMPNAFKAAAGATIIPLEAHIRFLREVLPGAVLNMRGGVLEMSETEAVLYCELRHGDGAPASTFRLRVAHVEPRKLKAFPWPAKCRAAFARLKCVAPAHGLPRCLDITRPPASISMQRADALGVRQTGRSIVIPADCDAFDRLRPDVFIGHVSNAAPNLLADSRAQAAKMLSQADGAQRIPGGAVVEFRIVYRSWPRAGDHIVVRSAVVDVQEKHNRLVHWLLDPATGAGWASVEGAAVAFDLASRKAYVSPPEVRASLQRLAIPAMQV